MRPGNLAIGGAIVYAAVAATFSPFSWPMRVAVALGIVAIVALALRQGWHRSGPVDDTAPRQRGLRTGIVVLAVIGLVQLELYLSSPRDSYPTMSSLASSAFALWPVRAAMLLGWLAGGWYLVER